LRDGFADVKGDNDMPAKPTVGSLLTVGGLLIVLLGWAIAVWANDRDFDALNQLLVPLGTVLLYGGLIMLLAGIAWFAVVYYRAKT
jgi:uncharacterized membrane protein